VIATATNAVVGIPIPVGREPFGVAVTPDGKHAYVANAFSSNVSVIATATNTVVTTVMAGNIPFGVGIMPPSKGISFSAFNAKLEIDLEQNSNRDSFDLQSSFALASDSGSIIPVTLAVTLRVGTFTTIIPPDSFKAVPRSGVTDYLFRGMIEGVDLKVLIEAKETSHYALRAEARGANLTGTRNPVPVTLGIGDDGVATSVNADVDH
jgi:YVTN family beta-propeller protein